MIEEDNKIADIDKLYYRVPKSLCEESPDYNIVSPHAFNPVNDSLSTNWDKFCDANGCLEFKTDNYPEGRTSKTHGIGHFIAGEIRELTFLEDKLEVKYIGNSQNPSHVGVFGMPASKPKQPYNEMKVKLQRIFKKWDIKPVD